MLENIINKFRKRSLLAKWRRRSRRKKNIRLYVSDLAGMFNDFDSYGIEYVVLRWFDEVPVTREQEFNHDDINDVDILINVDDLDGVAEIVCLRPGRIKCDLYNVTGRRGMSYLGMQYFPATLAKEILEKRVRYNSTFYVPDDFTSFLSLAYHLVYHKGFASGILSGCQLQSDKAPKRPYGLLLEKLGQSLDIDISPPYTLLKLHKYLKRHGWDMPYDLIERWPRRTEWHKELLRVELGILDKRAQKLPDLLVFFIREDMIQLGLTDTICDMLREKFAILKTINLSQEQIDRVVRQVRGGNWLEYKGTAVVPPKIAVLCYDNNPVGLDESDEDKTRDYPLVKNRNVFHKHDIRERLKKITNSSKKVTGIHGSDNAYESQHMLRAIFGDDQIEPINTEILSANTPEEVF